jgi:hypothetical protein
MNIFLIKDYCTVDGKTGAFLGDKQGDYQRCNQGEAFTLHSARNQYVSFQVVFDCGEGGAMSGADVKFSGDIREGDITCHVEWMHVVEGTLAPDLLIPYKGNEHLLCVPQQDTEGHRAAVLWVDVWVPKDAPVGALALKLDLAANGHTAAFEINIAAHKTILPDRGFLTIALNSYTDSLSKIYPSLANNKNRFRDGSFFAIEKAHYRMAREHRALFQHLPYQHSGYIPESFTPELEGEGVYMNVKSWDLYDEHFGPYLDGSAFAGTGREWPLESMYLPFNLCWPASYEKWGTKGYRTETRRVIREFVRHFEEMGWLETNLELFLNNKKFYRFQPYTLDEVWYEHDEEGLDYYYSIVKDSYDSTAVPVIFRQDISNMIGFHMTPESRFADMFDLWICNDGMLSWYPESVEMVKQKGQKCWTYGGVPGIGDSSLLMLLKVLKCFSIGIHGYVPWNTINAGDDFLKTPAEKGGVALFYPGHPFGINGPVPSLRLKQLRNFTQVADMACMSHGYAHEGSNLNARAKGIVNKSVGYTHDGQWWAPQPEYLKDPPRTWDWERKTQLDIWKIPLAGNSPAMVEGITQGILELLDEGIEW